MVQQVHKINGHSMLSAEEAGKYCGVARRTFMRTAEEEGIQPINFPTDAFRREGNRRHFYRASDVERVKQKHFSQRN